MGWSTYFTVFLLFVLIVFYQNTFGQKEDGPNKSPKKTAIIIGQSNYFFYDTLPISAADADGMTDAFRHMGFTVLKYMDLNRLSLFYFINKWRQSLNKGDIVVFYFSGHGVEVDGEDYLVPTDGKFYSSGDVRRQCYNLSQLIHWLDSCDHMADIVFMDACRAQLDAAGQWIQKKYTPEIQTVKSLAGFATSRGDRIFSRPGDSLSLYTNSIMKHIYETLSVDQLLSEVQREVATETKQKQVPQKSNRQRMEDISLASAEGD